MFGASPCSSRQLASSAALILLALLIIGIVGEFCSRLDGGFACTTEGKPSGTKLQWRIPSLRNNTAVASVRSAVRTLAGGASDPSTAERQQASRAVQAAPPSRNIEVRPCEQLAIFLAEQSHGKNARGVQLHAKRRFQCHCLHTPSFAPALVTLPMHTCTTGMCEHQHVAAHSPQSREAPRRVTADLPCCRAPRPRTRRCSAASNAATGQSAPCSAMSRWAATPRCCWCSAHRKAAPRGSPGPSSATLPSSAPGAPACRGATDRRSDSAGVCCDAVWCVHA